MLYEAAVIIIERCQNELPTAICEMRSCRDESKTDGILKMVAISGRDFECDFECDENGGINAEPRDRATCNAPVNDKSQQLASWLVINCSFCWWHLGLEATREVNRGAVTSSLRARSVHHFPG